MNVAASTKIGASGEVARGLEVDALDEESVGRFVETVVGEAGRLDISFSLVSVGDVQGTPLGEMEWADFSRPIENAVRSNFLTVKAAVPAMVRSGGGGVLFFGGAGDPVPNYSIGGFQDGGPELARSLNEATMTGRAATLEDVGAVAAFVASDKARR